MSELQFPYQKPALQYWTADELNSIEATMSGGGGYIPSTSSVFLLNNVDGLSAVGDYGVLGHAAIMIQNPANSLYSLYNFCPYDNEAPFADGSVAVFVAGELGLNSFYYSCRNGGPLITNGFISNWCEGFDRCIRITVDSSVCNMMRDYANNKINNPNYYSVIAYNCLTFVIDVLSYGGITIYDNNGLELNTCLVPNIFFSTAASCSLGVFHALQSI